MTQYNHKDYGSDPRTHVNAHWAWRSAHNSRDGIPLRKLAS